MRRNGGDPVSTKTTAMEFDKIQMAIKTLRDEGYFVEHLWHIDDVQERFKCTDEQAHDVLYNVLRNGMLLVSMYELIEEECNSHGYDEID